MYFNLENFIIEYLLIGRLNKYLVVIQNKKIYSYILHSEAQDLKFI